MAIKQEHFTPYKMTQICKLVILIKLQIVFPFETKFWGNKKNVMLNSAEHEISNANKYENIKKFGFFSGLDKPRMLFFLLINVKMPTTVSILTLWAGKISCSAELSMKKKI